MGWKNILSPPPSDLTLEDALKQVNELLENARQAKPTKALQLCNEAKSKLKVTEKVFAAKKVGGSDLDNGIAHAYHDHAQLLDDLGYDEMAQKSHSKAEKWGYVHPISIAGTIRQLFCPPAALTVMPSATEALHQNIHESSIAQPAHQDLKRTVTPVKTESCTPDAGGNTSQTTQIIFSQNIIPSVKYTLPELGGRFTSTPQLAYCLSLLLPSLRSKNGFDENEMTWSQARTNDSEEQKRVQTVATNIIREFVHDELKKPDAVSEVVCLAALLDQDDFRDLLHGFVNGIEKSVLLRVHLLHGLAQLLGNANPEYIDSDDLVKILDLLNTRLKETHQQSTEHIYRLALTVSRVLDSMVDNQVKGLKREQLHKPLFDYLKGLQDSSDPSLVYQAVYGYQALLYIPDDESTLQAMLRRTGKVTQGISGVVSAVKALDLNQFIDGLQNIQKGLEGAGDAIKLFGGAYGNVETLAESGKQLKECLVEGLSFSRKSAWYPALRGLDAFLQEGKLVEFEKLIREAPCRQDAPFQWGVCQRLGEIAANTHWDNITRLSAISFLEEIYNDDAKWAVQAEVKVWIICILSQFTNSTDTAVAADARALVQQLKAISDLNSHDFSKVNHSVHQGPCVLMLTPLAEASPLLDLVQNKPDVETALRQLKLKRLAQGKDVYISPRAKAHIKVIDDFDLTSNVQAFLASNKKVFLILGDSGAGKSTGPSN
ncbi:hypothetical protein BGZ80_010930 [Entomortierella chlamydospora]|uniref:Arm-like repeat domain-containing protein n=1 Tax=Entomortierella chlamydospora TaxID=101097 RepID=A0A9P6SZE2_9FUNG|nr:hypothetical protein BGZ80_010930 [Entomortierella chlamydospora]